MTSTVQLGTSVAVVPLRAPLLNAAMLATIDALSSGRLLYGAGVGWLAEEAAALGAPWDDRGARTDEHLEILRLLWSSEDQFVSHSGSHYRFEDIDPRPHPTQRGGPPILIGGHSDIALDRVGRLGDGWVASRLPPDRLASGFERAQRAALAHGRDPSHLRLFANLDLSPSADVRSYTIVQDAEVVLAGFDHAGTPPRDTGEIVAMLRTYEAAGCHHLKLSARMASDAAELEWIEWLGRDVLPAFERSPHDDLWSARAPSTLDSGA